MALAVADPRGAGRIYNVGDEPTLTEREWVERIAVAAGWQGSVVTVPPGGLHDGAEQPSDWRYSLWTDTTAIRRELGFVERVPLDEAIRLSVAWERSQGGCDPPRPHG